MLIANAFPICVWYFYEFFRPRCFPCIFPFYIFDVRFQLLLPLLLYVAMCLLFTVFRFYLHNWPFHTRKLIELHQQHLRQQQQQLEILLTYKRPPPWKKKTEIKKWKPMVVGVQVLGSTVNSHKCFVYVYNLAAAAAAPADVAFAFDIALAAAVALLHCRCCSVFLPQFVTPLMLLTWLLQHASPLLSSRTA